MDPNYFSLSRWLAHLDYFWLTWVRLHIASYGQDARDQICPAEDQARLVLSGRSIPENAVDFYRPDLGLGPRQCPKDFKLTVQVQLGILQHQQQQMPARTCSSGLSKAIDTLEVQWYFDADDEDMLEAGEDYDHIVERAVQVRRGRPRSV